MFSRVAMGDFKNSMLEKGGVTRHPTFSDLSAKLWTSIANATSPAIPSLSRLSIASSSNNKMSVLPSRECMLASKCWPDCSSNLDHATIRFISVPGQPQCQLSQLFAAGTRTFDLVTRLIPMAC